ncbi:MAG: hypothetical protein WD491_02560 [Balneolales bacterium]
MLNTTAVESLTSYDFTVTDGMKTFKYSWSKDAPEGQTTEEYIQSCKREAELLARHELDKNVEPTELDIE